jgi:uncharacterized membrane protein HdeD (DUF308 family)
MAESMRERTTSDLVIGALVVLLGLVILGHTAIATTVSVLFLGWLLFAGGVVTLAATLFRIGKDGFWTGAVAGGLMTVLGIVFLRHTSAAAVTLTLVAGAMFLTSGLARLVMAAHVPEARVPLILSGAVSTLLGLLVLFNLFTASLGLLGLLLGLEVLFEGLAIMLVGRQGLSRARFGGAVHA